MTVATPHKSQDRVHDSIRTLKRCASVCFSRVIALSRLLRLPMQRSRVCCRRLTLSAWRDMCSRFRELMLRCRNINRQAFGHHESQSFDRHSVNMKVNQHTSMQTLSMLCASSKTTTHSFSISRDTICETFGSIMYW